MFPVNEVPHSLVKKDFPFRVVLQASFFQTYLDHNGFCHKNAHKPPIEKAPNKTIMEHTINRAAFCRNSQSQ
jgi:hypothetical protein